MVSKVCTDSGEISSSGGRVNVCLEDGGESCWTAGGGGSRRCWWRELKVKSWKVRGGRLRVEIFGRWSYRDEEEGGGVKGHHSNSELDIR